MIDDVFKKSAIARRQFLKSGALGAGAAVTLTGCGGQEDKLIPLLITDDRILPGEDRWTASTCGICSAGCGILVRSMLGEAKVRFKGQERRQMILQVKKIEGNPRHPVNQGKLCARGQAGPQILYNPDRIQYPMKLAGSRGSGQYKRISWDDALALLESKLESLQSTSTPQGLAAISGYGSPRRTRLLRQFLTALGSDRCYQEDPKGIQVLQEANRRVFGRSELEVHDLENANYLLSFGADFVETHTSPVRYNLGLGHLRQGRPGKRGKLVQVEARFSLTAANADEWIPARPGTEAKVALAMAHVILKDERYPNSVRSSTRGFDEFKTWVLSNYAPENISKEADVPSDKITRIAREFVRHQPGLALSGGSAITHPHGVLTAAAVQSLNILVGNLGQKGGLSWTKSSAERGPSVRPVEKFWAEDFLSTIDSVAMLILWGADPIYTTPASLGLREGLKEVPFIVAFSPFMDDSTAWADLVLPDQTFLEKWDITEPQLTVGNRIISITQPIVRPMYESKDCADVLLELAKKLVAEALPDANFRDYLRRCLSEEDVLDHGSFSEEDFDNYWSKLSVEGVWEDSASENSPTPVDLSYLTTVEPMPTIERKPREYNFYLQPFESVAFAAGSTANLPWMQELPDPMTSVVWGSWVEINPSTAKELSIEEGELVWLESAHGKIQLPAILYPGARPDTVNVPFGQGHEFYGRYAAGRGANPATLISPQRVKDTGELAWGAARVKITKTGQKGRVIKIGYDREHSTAELHR